MIRDARDKLLTLVNRATSPTDGDDHEARTAAVQACKLIAKHPELVAAPEALAPYPSSTSLENARAEVSTVHPDAERLRVWRTLMERKQLREGHADRPSICADCGKPIAEGEPIVERPGDNLATHLACATWWRNFPSPRSMDYDLAS